MSLYYETTTGRYPVYLGELQNTYGVNVDPNNPPVPFVKVQEQSVPTVNFNQKVVPGTPTQVNGVYVQVWQVVELTADELNAKSNALGSRIRSKRNAILMDTDWTQNLDSPLNDADKDTYKVYRQALRDVSNQQGFPQSVTWPTPPTGYNPEQSTLVNLLEGRRRF